MSGRVLERLRIVEQVYVFIIFWLISLPLDQGPNFPMRNRIQKSQRATGLETCIKNLLYVGSGHLKVHKREKFFGSDFEFFTIL